MLDKSGENERCTQACQSLVSVLATLTDVNKAPLSQVPLLDDSRPALPRPALHEEGRELTFLGSLGLGLHWGRRLTLWSK